jgi:chorismate dehydratase
MIRIGEITYANCVPIFAALRKMAQGSEYIFVRGEPSELNRMLYKGEIDLSPSSSFEYALHPGEYLLAPGLSISSEREVKSVLLFSRYPIEALHEKTVLLSSASASSNALIQILLNKQFGHRCSYHLDDSGDSGLRHDGDARLMIGNPALKAHLEGEGEEYVYDLSLLWKEFTGLPFVFALWIIRRDAVRRMPGEIFRLVQGLYKAKDYAALHFSELAGDFETIMEIPKDELVRYWETISYDLDELKIKSLRLYYDYAEELGLIPQSPPLEFYEESGSF